MSQLASTAATAALGDPHSLPSVDLEPIRRIHEEFARQLQLTVPAILHSDITVKVTDARQDTYAGFRREFASPVYLCPVALVPGERSAVLHFSPEILFPILEVMMGGTITPSTDPGRRLTAVEEDILQPLIQMFLKALSRAWKPTAQVEFRKSSQIPLSHEAVVIVILEVEIGEEVRGSLSIALPSVLTRKAKVQAEALPAPSQSADGPGAEAMLKLIEPAVLEFEARLHGPKVGLQDLLNMKEGQIVLLDSAADQGVDGLLNKAPHFRGQIVSDGKRRLLLIEGFREPEKA